MINELELLLGIFVLLTNYIFHFVHVGTRAFCGGAIITCDDRTPRRFTKNRLTAQLYRIRGKLFIVMQASGSADCAIFFSVADGENIVDRSNDGICQKTVVSADDESPAGIWRESGGRPLVATKRARRVTALRPIRSAIAV